MPKEGGKACYLVVPLALPGIETEPRLEVLAEVRSPRPAAGVLEAAGKRCSLCGDPGKQGEAGASEGKGGRDKGLESGKEGYLGSGDLSRGSAWVPHVELLPGERLPGCPRLCQPGALALKLPLLPELGGLRWLQEEGVVETLGA